MIDLINYKDLSIKCNSHLGSYRPISIFVEEHESLSKFCNLNKIGYWLYFILQPAPGSQWRLPFSSHSNVDNHNLSRNYIYYFRILLFFFISKTIIFKENLIKYSWIPWGWDQVDEVVSPLLLVSPDRDTDWTQRMEKLHNFSSYHSLNKSSEVIKNLFLWLLQEGSKLFMFILLSPVWKYEKYWNMKMKRIVNQISSRE